MPHNFENYKILFLGSTFSGPFWAMGAITRFLKLLCGMGD
jgi:hypothetical protein